MKKNKNNILKVLVVSNKYPLHQKDNTVVFLKTLYNEIAKFHKVEIIAADNISVKDEDNESSNLKIFRFKYWFRKWQTLAYNDAILSNLKKNPLNYFQIPFFMFSMFLEIYKRIRKNRPDIIHAHWVFPCGFLSLLLCNFFKIPLIVTSHGGDLYGLRGGIKESLIKYTLNRSQIVNPVSKALEELISNDFNIHDSKVIPMGVNEKQFYYVENAKHLIGYSDDVKLILFVGRLSEKKGVNVLLDAIHLIEKQNLLSNYKLLIIGSGNLEEPLKEKTSKLNLLDVVEFIGSIPNYKLKEYYSAADVLTLPSISAVGGQEGLPVTLMEGLLCNCNIIATDSGGMKYLHGNKQITMISQNDKDGLAESIINNINIPKTSNSALADSFKVKNVAAKYIDCYQSLIS